MRLPRCEFLQRRRFVVLSALVFSLMIALPGSCARALEKGIQDGWAVDDADHVLLTPQVAWEMRASGATWVRLHFRLNARHKSWTDSLLDAYAEVVANLEKEHLKILGLVTYESWPGSQADWIEHNAEVAGGSGDNAYLRGLTGVAFHRLLRRFPSVRSWEIWNEPNAWTTNPPGKADRLPGGFFIYPSNFAWLLRRAFEETRALPKPVTLVSGGILSADFTDSLDANIAAPYLRDTWKAGRSLAGWDALKARYHSWPLDGWGLHLYLKAGSRVASDDVAAYAAAFAKLRDQMEGGTTRKPIWITEIGWATPPGQNNLSEADQAANVTSALTALNGQASVGPVLWFTLHDNPAAALFFGLRHADDTPKPAWDAFHNAPPASAGTGSREEGRSLREVTARTAVVQAFERGGRGIRATAFRYYFRQAA